MSNNEWKLAEDAKNGDVTAFARLYERYYQDLYRFAVCFLKNTTLAEDVVSDAVLKAFEHIGSLRKTVSFKSWIFQITANECRSVIKKQKRYVTGNEWEEPAGQETGFDLAEIRELFLELSEDESLVLSLSVFGGYKSREIARMIGKREGSVRSLKSRALAKLKKSVGR